MKLNKLFLFVTLTTLLCAGVVMAQEKVTEKLGKVHFLTSCTPAAQQEFDRAVALLHSFSHGPMRQAFEAVIQRDPGCAMGYWGIAMSLLDNPLAAPPSPAALKEAWGAIEKAKALGAKSQRERDYIAAIEMMYKDPDTRVARTRALAYEKAMEQLHQRYPEDREAAIFYALALNMTALPTDKTYANQLKAAEILGKVFAEQPEHPGVAHYLIHSYDYPPIAHKGLSAAQRYADIAPSAPHALHMPSHIFTRLGLWQESIKSNRASRAVADLRGKLHASDYMTYAYLQVGQDLEAKRVVEELSGLRKVDALLVTAYALATIPARYALERRQWAEAASLTPHPSDFAWSRFPMAEAITLFARGLGAARSGNPDNARIDMQRLQPLHEALTKAKQAYWAEQVEIQRQVVAAWIARTEGKNEEAFKFMRAAADLEDKTEKHIVSPGPIVPARELLGEMFLEVGNPGQALKEFEASHRVEPNRFRGLYGAAKAAHLAGDREKASHYYAKLVSLCESADTDRPELKKAKAFLTKK
ncbi:MAG: hypothetical protein HY694_04675 [Deltaproteobacteria bacterium]|nr:hypothetical protein [Deltaproteobacteria bacterium]